MSEGAWSCDRLMCSLRPDEIRLGRSTFIIACAGTNSCSCKVWANCLAFVLVEREGQREGPPVMLLVCFPLLYPCATAGVCCPTHIIQIYFLLWSRLYGTHAHTQHETEHLSSHDPRSYKAPTPYSSTVYSCIVHRKSDIDLPVSVYVPCSPLQLIGACISR